MVRRSPERIANAVSIAKASLSFEQIYWLANVDDAEILSE